MTKRTKRTLNKNARQEEFPAGHFCWGFLVLPCKARTASRSSPGTANRGRFPQGCGKCREGERAVGFPHCRGWVLKKCGRGEGTVWEDVGAAYRPPGEWSRDRKVPRAAYTPPLQITGKSAADFPHTRGWVWKTFTASNLWDTRLEFLRFFFVKKGKHPLWKSTGCVENFRGR